jgi:hypothetical protein
LAGEPGRRGPRTSRVVHDERSARSNQRLSRVPQCRIGRAAVARARWSDRALALRRPGSRAYAVAAQSPVLGRRAARQDQDRCEKPG